MKISLLSNITMDLLPDYLNKELQKRGEIEGEFYVAPYNQYVQELTNINSEIYKNKSGIIIVYLEGDEIFPKLLSDILIKNSKSVMEEVNQQVENYWRLLVNYAQVNPLATILINTIMINPYSVINGLEYNSGFSEEIIESIYNNKIRDLVVSSDLPNIIVVDVKKLVMQYGFKNITDNRMYYLGRIKYNKRGFEILAELYVNYILAKLGRIKKVIVLDMDNTLWGGVVGEDGIDGIRIGHDGIGKAYYDFQVQLKKIKQKGILLTICSKNNYDDVKAVFENHPAMVLRLDDFSCIKINWKDKVENIREIEEELNLCHDSFVFIDDNPFERFQVKEFYPTIETPNFPDEPAGLPCWLSDLSFKYFNKLSITGEDENRTTLYEVEKRRKSLREKIPSLDEFYKKLNMKVIIEENDKTMIKRIAQLTQRTNQFNMTTRRYTEQDIISFMNSPDYSVFSLELIDNFGNNGVVGVIIFKMRKDDKRAEIDTFLLSCRVIGRTVENAFLGYTIKKIKGKNNLTGIIIGVYIPSPKNSLVKNLYEKLGFRKETETDNRIEYLIDLEKEEINIPEWIYVEE